MSKRTTKNITTIKKRGVTFLIDEKVMAEQDRELAQRQAAADEHSRVFHLMDAVSQAKTSLEGTVQVMSVIIDADKEYTEGVPATLERWIKVDMEALDRACDAAWDGIVRRQTTSAVAKTGGNDD